MRLYLERKQKRKSTSIDDAEYVILEIGIAYGWLYLRYNVTSFFANF